jgi:hypothetical protein
MLWIVQSKIRHLLIHHSLEGYLIENMTRELHYLNIFFISDDGFTLNFPSFKSTTRISRLHNTANSCSPTGQIDDGWGTPFNVRTLRHLELTNRKRLNWRGVSGKIVNKISFR